LDRPALDRPALQCWHFSAALTFVKSTPALSPAILFVIPEGNLLLPFAFAFARHLEQNPKIPTVPALTLPNQCGASAPALLFVIPEGNLLLPFALAFACHPEQKPKIPNI
jgi:hypothetical protein